MPPTTTKSTRWSASVMRIWRGSKGVSGGSTMWPPRRGHSQLARELVERQAALEPGRWGHAALGKQISGIKPALEGACRQHRLLPHRKHDRAQPWPGDLLVPALDPGDRALARAGAQGQAALAEALAFAGLADELCRYHDAVYG